MVGLSHQRLGVRMIMEKGLSERRACRIINISRKTARNKPKVNAINEKLSVELKSIASRHLRYGYRFAKCMLDNQGMHYNHKRIERIWSKEGLGIRKRRKRLRRQYGITAMPLQKAMYPNHVWSYDFVHDRTFNGRKLKFLNIIDEYTRECLEIKVGKSISANSVKESLQWLFSTRGVPEHIRSDNGPEFIARALNQWLSKESVKTLFIKPGSPWENPYIERFNGTFRDSVLRVYSFLNGPEAQRGSDEFKQQYNHERPHSSLGYKTPYEFRLAYEQKTSPGFRFSIFERSKIENPALCLNN